MPPPRNTARGRSGNARWAESGKARVVDRAGIEYGRIDYGVVDGKIRVWGINTNPTVMSDRLRMARWRRHRQKLFVERYRGGLDALDTPQGPPIPLTFPDFPHQSSPGSS